MVFNRFTAVFLGFVSAAISLTPAINLERGVALDYRQECDPSWPLCPGGLFCHPPGTICCSAATYAPAGATCCTDGTYVVPPDTCVGGTRPPLDEPTSTITAGPSTTETVVEYIWFTTEFTWYYWYYYYTFIITETTSILTSSEVFATTTVSVSATDSAGASALFSSLSASINFPTPVQTTTSIEGSAPPPPTSSPALAANTTTLGSTTAPVTVTTTSSAPTTVVTAGAARLGTATYGDQFFVVIIGAMIVVPAFLMIQL
ncbi:hypothetical protein GQ53DRAFT_834093 [Thozetella sp. PMI_491]|nr:hypothetical protein GQ53DRAFT_834093 [Thozetella sp. PMI_491]